MSGFKAPEHSGNRNEVELLPTGFQLCTFYGLCDIGTQETNFGSKHQVNLGFEFPLVQRVFFDDKGQQPCAVFSTETFSMYGKGNLRKRYIQPMSGRSLTDAEAEDYDISQLLGKQFVATITHSSDGKWANIESITPLSEQNKAMFGIQNINSVAQINPTYYFHLSDGFQHQNFAELPKFLRDKLMISEEGKAHKIAGGTFADQVVKTSAPSSPSAPISPSGAKKLVMLGDVPYESFKANGWTDQQLVDNNHAKWNEPVAPQAPQAPSAPVAPQAPPVPSAPQVPPTSPPQPVLVFKDPNQKLEDWIKNGWTEEMIVKEGYASFQ